MVGGRVMEGRVVGGIRVERDREKMDGGNGKNDVKKKKEKKN